MKENLRKYLVELIGTFFLVFTVGSAVMFGNATPANNLAIGFALMIMVYAGGHISGGHYNPAVSLAAAIRGALAWNEVLPYWLAQILGGTLAALLVTFFVGGPTVCECPFTVLDILVGEFLFTFALCYVVLQTATAKGTEGNSFYGLAIGATVIVGAFAVGGSLCHGAFNPAVATSLSIMGAACAPCIGLTILANLLAAVAAAYTFKFVNPEN